jgi:hypothetical protein
MGGFQRKLLGRMQSRLQVLLCEGDGYPVQENHTSGLEE